MLNLCKLWTDDPSQVNGAQTMKETPCQNPSQCLYITQETELDQNRPTESIGLFVPLQGSKLQATAHYM